MTIFKNIMLNRDFYDVDIVAAPTPNHKVIYNYDLACARLYTGDQQATLAHQRIFAVMTHYFENRSIGNQIDIDVDSFSRLVRMRKNDMLSNLDTFITNFKVALVRLNIDQRNVCTRRYFDDKRAFVKNIMYFKNMNVLRIVVDNIIRDKINNFRKSIDRRGFSKNFLWQQVSHKSIYSMQSKNFFERMKDIKQRVKTDYSFKHLLHILPIVLPESYKKFGNFVKLFNKIKTDFMRFARETIVDFNVFRKFNDGELKVDDNELAADFRKMVLSGKRVAHLSFVVKEADDVAKKHLDSRIGKILDLESSIEKTNSDYKRMLKAHKNDNIKTTDEYNFSQKITDDSEMLLKTCNISIAKAYQIRNLAVNNGTFRGDDSFISMLLLASIESTISKSVKNQAAFIASLVKNGYNINAKLFFKENRAISMTLTQLSALRLEDLLKYELINAVCYKKNNDRRYTDVFKNTAHTLRTIVDQKKAAIHTYQNYFVGCR